MTEQNSNQASLDAIAPVLGRIPSGVFILTATDGAGHSTGMLTSWVQQAGFDPPTLTIAVNNARYLNDWLKQHPYLSLNLVGQSQGFLLSHFGKGFEPEENAFEKLATEVGHHQIPCLKDAIGVIECAVTDQFSTGDHIIYIAVITNAQSRENLETEKPMVHIRKNGLKY